MSNRVLSAPLLTVTKSKSPVWAKLTQSMTRRWAGLNSAAVTALPNSCRPTAGPTTPSATTTKPRPSVWGSATVGKPDQTQTEKRAVFTALLLPVRQNKRTPPKIRGCRDVDNYGLILRISVRAANSRYILQPIVIRRQMKQFATQIMKKCRAENGNCFRFW